MGNPTQGDGKGGGLSQDNVIKGYNFSGGGTRGQLDSPTGGNIESVNVIDTLPNLPNVGPEGSIEASTKSSRLIVNPFNDIMRFRIPSVYVDYAVSGYEYIFMTKPDLNLSESSNTFISFLNNNHPDVLDYLTHSGGGPTSSFIPVITNLYESFDLDDVSLNETMESESWRGYGQRLPTHLTDTINGGQFSINYDELMTPKITYLHKAWVEYMDDVKAGYASPRDVYVQSKTLDYTSSLYYFLTDPDGETLRLWAKYTGVTPKSIPYSGFTASGRNDHSFVKVSIQYLYSYRELLNTEVIDDFNTVAGMGGGQHLTPQGEGAFGTTYKPTMNEIYSGVNITNFSNNEGHTGYKLVFN